MNKTKIEWCDTTWNPVWGCLRNCTYCYARKIAKRFGENIADKEKIHNILEYMALTDDIKNFKPTWIESNFQKKFPKNPSRIFVNSMSDIAYWNLEWMDKVLKKIEQYPQHTFLFLTKNPKIYNNHDYPKNCWLGATINTEDQYQTIGLWGNIKFLSIEPIQEFITSALFKKKYIDWIIIGAETGNRKGKVIPQKEWLDELVRLRKEDIKIFMKDSLKSIWGENLIQEYPHIGE